jgi:hypothetical protein
MLVHYGNMLVQQGAPPRAIAMHGEHMCVMVEAHRARCDEPAATR